MDGLLFWLVVTSGSLMTWLAYNEPIQFKHKLPFFIAIPSLTWLGFSVWMFAIRWVRRESRSILDNAAHRKLSALLDGVEPPPLIVFSAAFGIILFFAVLKFWVSEMKDGKPE